MAYFEPQTIIVHGSDMYTLNLRGVLMEYVDINLVGDPERIKRFARTLLDNEELNVSERLQSAPFELSLVVERCMISFSYTPTPRRQSELRLTADRSFLDVVKHHSYLVPMEVAHASSGEALSYCYPIQPLHIRSVMCSPENT